MPVIKVGEQRINFPDTMTREEIAAALQQRFAQNQESLVDAPEIPETLTPTAGTTEAETGFGDIPGVAQVAELAGGFNRPFAELIDLLGTRRINDLLELAGSEQRIPDLASVVGQRGFVEPGLQQDILSAAGETAALALGGGAALRGLASRLPAAVPGESVGSGVLRQAAASTPAQDVALGALAGAGAEIGEEVAGDTGELVGGVVTPIVAVPLVAAKNTATQLLREAAPDIDTLKSTARGIYQSLDDSGARIAPSDLSRLVDDISGTLAKEGLDPTLTPNATGLVNRLSTESGSKTLSEIDTLRKVAQNAAQSGDPPDRRLGQLAVDKIDDFLDDVNVTVGDRAAGQAYRSARDLWSRAKKAETLDMMVENADLGGSGFENGLRNEFRALAKRINKGQARGYTQQEKNAIDKVVKGTTAGNVARFLGKFGVLDGITSRSLTTISGASAAGFATGNPVAAAAVPLVGQVSGRLAERMTLNNAKMANEIIRAGKNATKIAQVYTKNTPKIAQEASELAELFIKNQVPVDTLKSQNPLIQSAAVMAAIAKQNDLREDEEVRNGTTD